MNIEDFYRLARHFMNKEARRQLEQVRAEVESPIAVTDGISAHAYMEMLANHATEWNETLFLQAEAILQLEKDAAHDSLLKL